MVEYYPNKVCACGCGGCIVIRKQHSFPSVGIPKFMPFHDYDKNNNKPENLISLCCSCHSKTNVKREYWIKYFQSVSFSSLLIRTILPNGAVEESAPSGVTHQIVE